MNRILPFSFLLMASCNPPPPSEPAVEVAVASQPQPEELPPKKREAPVVAVQPKKEEPPAPPPPTFPFPNDSAGKLLPKVVTPPMPPAPAGEKFGVTPKPRTTPGKLIEPDGLQRVIHFAPPLLTGKTSSAAPTAPAERVPFDLGAGSGAVPARPAFPEAPGIAVKARDVKLPPDLAPLGRQLPDRASLDDPTSDAANGLIANKSPTPVLGQSGFLKVTLPDPFELGEQVKPKVPPAAEPNPAPVVVNPQRPK